MYIPKNILDAFDEYCKKNNISEKEKEEKFKLLSTIIKKYLYEPGEAIGIIAAQSISEPATQMTMRSYTLASQSDRLSKVTHGLPRLIEIFDARKTFEKNMIIFLKPEYNTMEKAKEFASKIKALKISDLITYSSIDLIELRIEMEVEKESNKNKIKEILDKYVKNCEISLKGKKIYIKPEKNDAKNLRKLKNKILKLHVDGIKGIENVVVIKDGDDWVIRTTGSNLKKILSLDWIDIERTRTNDVYQVYEVLGIEAARNVILQETKNTLDEQGLDVDIRHIRLLADMMTFDGTIKDIGRYGVSGKKASVLARANFEETKKHLVNASFYGESDNLDGIIENVLLGQIAPIGTGMVKLTVDVEKLRKKK
ncbi:MAG: DNA-directed RNA polymerase subunit A'' [Candidatus Aenigmatarchaeota archaeon]